MSGARELAAQAGSAKVYLSHEGGEDYGYEHEAIRHGQSFRFGKTLLTVHRTPGHTPEHVSFIAADAHRPDTPWGVFSGDSLFVNSAGRPDLLGAGSAQKLADALYHTLYDFYLTLPESVLIYPAHGHGSPCGADIGDRLSSSIGYERKFNPFLQHPGQGDFVQYALSTAPPEPVYYPRMKKVNRDGPTLLNEGLVVPGLPPKEFQRTAESGAAQVIDTRSMLAFGGGHIAGALNIGARPELSLWAGWMLDPDRPLLLVLAQDHELLQVLSLLLRTGYTRIAGYLVGGMRAWDNAGLPIVPLPQMPVQQLRDATEVITLDVRSPGEWKQGHIPGARHMFLPQVPTRLAELDRSQPIATYCDSGYRASLAASILQAQGFRSVNSVPGSWQAWRNAGYPVAQP